MASLSTCHLGLWLGWQILLNIVKVTKLHQNNCKFCLGRSYFNFATHTRTHARARAPTHPASTVTSANHMPTVGATLAQQQQRYFARWANVAPKSTAYIVPTLPIRQRCPNHPPSLPQSSANVVPTNTNTV